MAFDRYRIRRAVRDDADPDCAVVEVWLYDSAASESAGEVRVLKLVHAGRTPEQLLADLDQAAAASLVPAPLAAILAQVGAEREIPDA